MADESKPTTKYLEEDLRKMRSEARQEYLAQQYPQLRDQLAMAVVSGLTGYHATNGLADEMLAARAYQIADAMLRERAKEMANGNA